MGIKRSNWNLSNVKWEDAPTLFTKRSGVITEIWGPTGSGRTHLALTAPGPIAYIYFHEKIDGVIQKFAKQKEIRCLKAGGVFRGDEDEIQSAAQVAMQEYEAAYYDSFNWARSTIVDTHNEAWVLERLGEFGALKPVKGVGRKNLNVQRDYAGINNRWLSMLNMARTQDKTNVIFIGQVEDEWKDTPDGFGRRTGKEIRVSTTASRQVLLKSDISVRTDKKDGDFLSTIYKGWWNADSEDSVLKNDMSTFAMVCAVVTETDPDEWK